MKIKNLFDKDKDIYRSIEKVITYGAAQEARLKSEISEYIVTASIEEQFEKLLTRMQEAMEYGGAHEIGVWVSGFYGSGKSSLTKYLGFALDDSVVIDGQPFIKYLQDRMNRASTRALLNTVAKKFSAAIVMLDLASEMLASATMEDVATVLYYKVLQWAGYSRNLKVAAFERKLKKDGMYDHFCLRIQEEIDMSWQEIQNDPLVVDSLLPELAHELYPQLFRTPDAFSTESESIKIFENERVKEMLAIVKETTGKDYVIFIVDEVGQYVGSRPNLILNLDGLSKNLKEIGQGKAWIISTAQQTLTEDDPRTALNSPELFKLKDRFPIQIDLESSDIKEICIKRLLGKSSEGAEVLAKLFDEYGQALRHHTKLEDAQYYSADFDREMFIQLYPFLPAHFSILLQLLGALAKSTGGIGLRSAIKVIQDILVEGTDKDKAVVERDLGWLANTVILYDALEKDIGRAFPWIYRAVENVFVRFPDTALPLQIAKTVAVLQILGNLPITDHNVISLIQNSLKQPLSRDIAQKAIDAMIQDGHVTLGRKEHELVFYSEKVLAIEKEKSLWRVRSIDQQHILSNILRDLFTPLPSARLENTFVVSTGIKLRWGGYDSSLAADNQAIQLILEWVEPSEYETRRAALLDLSRQEKSKIFLLARTLSETEDLLDEVVRCQGIADKYRKDPDAEIKDYQKSQEDRAHKLEQDLQRRLKQQLSQGSFLFQGQQTAVESLHEELLEACKRQLTEVAQEVYSHYAEAPVRTETATAERFLKVASLRDVDSKTDPLGLVYLEKGQPRIQSNHKALISIKDVLERQGNLDGKTLHSYFGAPPFGWSRDTFRYLIAALLVAGEIKLRVAGREVLVKGQQAVEALKSNEAFKNVGVYLRDERPSLDVLDRASQRLTQLSGEVVMPLEDEISKIAVKYLARAQHQLSPLTSTLKHLNIKEHERLEQLSQKIADLLLTDASDAPQSFGSENSAIFYDLQWAQEVESALEQGLKVTLQEIQSLSHEILSLPNQGIPGQLKDELQETILQVQSWLKDERFYHKAADFRTRLSEWKHAVEKAVTALQQQLVAQARENIDDLTRISEWHELNQSEQGSIIQQVESSLDPLREGVGGIKTLLNQAYSLTAIFQEQRQRVQNLGKERQRKRLEEEQRQQSSQEEGNKKQLRRRLKLPTQIRDVQTLNDLIQRLQTLQSEFRLYHDISVQLELEDKDVI